MRVALTIAGSDSIGGAGIQADIKAMAAAGVHAAAAITAVTAQNTRKVSGIFPLPAETVRKQIDAVLEDCDVRAIKTGMLFNSGIAETVADAVGDLDAPLVVDPVMVATVGDFLSDKSLVRALKERLIPASELVTPNRHEAEILADMKIRSMDDAMLACEIIGKQGTSVLLKGGHMDTAEVIDLLYLSSEFTEIRNPRLGKAGHGSGCTLSAYITAHLAEGNDLVNSVLKSRILIQESIASQYSIGRGEPVVNTNVRGGKDKVKYSVLEALDEASRKLEGMLPGELVPGNGVNMAFAMPKAAGPEEIGAIDGGMRMHNGMLSKGGQAKFGAAEGLSFLLMEIMKKDSSCRCVLSLGLSGEGESVLEEVGLSAVRVSGRTPAESAREALSRCGGRVPDAMVDRKEKTIRILGKDPEDVLEKLNSIL